MEEKEYRIAGIKRDLQGKPVGFTYEEERLDEEFNVFLPYSDLRDVWIYTGDNIYRAFEAFPTWRLNYIRHLALLNWVGQDPDKIYPREFNHTRMNHTLVVAELVESILKRNGIDQKDIDIATAAAVLHDIATPAGGDPVKLVDPENLDEEKFWWDIVSEKGWNYLQGIGTSKESIDRIIKNKGLLGEVLDVADRIQYVMQDTFEIFGYPDQRFHFPGERNYSEVDEAYGQIEEELLKDPSIGEIYKEVMINSNDQLYFDNPERLGRFLKIRALLFKHLYANPFSQGKDLRLGNLVSRFYSSSGEDSKKLNPSMLRRMIDDELFRWLFDASKSSDKYQDSHFFFYDFVAWKPTYRYDRFDSLDEANVRADEIQASNLGFRFVGIREFRGFNPGTSYKVRNESGEIVEFKECLPGKAAEIEELLRSTKGVFVFYEVEAQAD